MGHRSGIARQPTDRDRAVLCRASCDGLLTGVYLPLRMMQWSPVTTCGGYAMTSVSGCGGGCAAASNVPVLPTVGALLFDVLRHGVQPPLLLSRAASTPAPNVFSDVDGEYQGWDGRVHTVAAGHTAHANFSGWDVYRRQIQLAAMLAPGGRATWSTRSWPTTRRPAS